MDRKWIWSVLAGVVVLAAIAGIGVYEYRLGLARGMAIAGNAPATPYAGAPMYPPYWYGHFFPFGFVFPLLLLFLVFGLSRRLFWWGGRGPGYWRRFDLDEWHRKAHESPAGQTGQTGD